MDLKSIFYKFIDKLKKLFNFSKFNQDFTKQENRHCNLRDTENGQAVSIIENNVHECVFEEVTFNNSTFRSLKCIHG